MKKIIAIWFASAVFTGFCMGVSADPLPKSGSASIRSIFKADAPQKFNDEYMHNTISGVNFNEEGEGLLHLGKAACSYSGFTHKQINKGVGFCAFIDKEGDKIFVQYAGTGNAKGEFNSVSEIIGGTGKFEGIRGQGSSACANTDKNGEFPCTEKFDYQLPE